jgi:hypothetical protein
MAETNRALNASTSMDQTMYTLDSHRSNTPVITEDYMLTEGKERDLTRSTEKFLNDTDANLLNSSISSP